MVVIGIDKVSKCQYLIGMEVNVEAIASFSVLFDMGMRPAIDLIIFAEIRGVFKQIILGRSNNK